ncbi:lysosomal-associated transmembrane protein 4A [Tetranychus urticae]|uniref:DUF7027 domain-containing protein n=1 Tax=Tetranychus urticae TaxID=32264 RepID=T1KK39_TETUR|nr:lysosomal-associated transmembrane protein 4A [Tetranychus urticae]
MMNIDSRSVERYSHCLCLHVQPTSLIIGFIHLISSLLNIVLHFEDYTQYHDEEKRMVDLHRSTTTSLNMMVSLMMATVSALLIYGVTKSRPSYLMPFFGIKLYIFFFSLPASISMLCFSPHLSSQYDSNGRTWGGEMKRLWSSSDLTTAYTSSVFMALIEFLYQSYFICVIWKCYRYLKLKESVIPLHIPYHLRGVEITVPSEIATTPSTMAPPDYETATKLNPPPDYESALKNYQGIPAPDQVTVTEPVESCRENPDSNDNINVAELPRSGSWCVSDESKASGKSDEKSTTSDASHINDSSSHNNSHCDTANKTDQNNS